MGVSLELPLARPLLHVTLGADYSFARAGRFEAMPHLSLWGFNAQTRVTRPEGRLHAFVAVLTFKGVELLAPGAAVGANGTCLDLLDRLGDSGSQLLHRLRSARRFTERCAVLQAYLRARAGEAKSASYTHQIADRIASNELTGAVAAVAHRVGVNERSLRNHFRARLGVSPKRMLRIARLNRMMRTLNPFGWGETAHGDVRLEFFDDAHFHNEFRQLTGLTPREFRLRKLESGDTLVYSLLGRPQARPAIIRDTPLELT